MGALMSQHESTTRTQDNPRPLTCLQERQRYPMLYQLTRVVQWCACNGQL